MGLLDSILRGGLGGLGGGLGGGRGLPMAGGGKARVLMALLPIVLQMVSNRQRGGSLGGAAPGGGLGGGLPGGLGGSGGLGGLLEQFRRRGYGAQADSWVGTGANVSLPSSAVPEVLGDDTLQQIAAQAGLSPDEAREGLSELLPEVVDHLTPDGQLPDDQRLEYGVDEFERQLRG